MNSDDTRWNTAVRVEAIKIVTVTVANGDRLTAASIRFVTFSGVQGTVTFSRVSCVPGIHKNLISVPKLIEKKSSLTTLKNKCVLESNKGHLCTSRSLAPSTLVNVSLSLRTLLHLKRLKGTTGRWHSQVSRMQQRYGIGELVISAPRQLLPCLRRRLFWESQSLKVLNLQVWSQSFSTQWKALLKPLRKDSHRHQRSYGNLWLLES